MVELSRYTAELMQGVATPGSPAAAAPQLMPPQTLPSGVAKIDPPPLPRAEVYLSLTVNGRPLRQKSLPENCQPLTMWPTMALAVCTAALITKSPLKLCLMS